MADEALVPGGDGDSGVEDNESSTRSLASSILRYREENGRTYHAKGDYPLPNDERELERLDLAHHLWILTLDGKLSLSPPSKRILDMGTGTGIWAIDYADEHPEAEVIGVDLSPTQPTWTPPNCRFEIDDLQNEWTWTTPFDLIVMRSLSGSFTLDGWRDVFRKAYDQLDPGGYVEIQEHEFPLSCDDDTLKDTHIEQWSQRMIEAGDIMGRPVNLAPKFKEMLEEAGFEDVKQVVTKVPINPWPRDPRYKEMGNVHCVMLGSDTGLEGVSLGFYVRHLQLTQEAALAELAEVRRDLRNRGIHAFWKAFCIYGRKPGGETTTPAAQA